MDSFTRSEVGRRLRPFGVANLLPFDVPVMMRILISNFRFYLPAAGRDLSICHLRSAIRHPQFVDHFLHILLVGSPPIDSPALGTPEELLLLVIDEVWNFSCRLLPRDFIEEGITEKTSAKEVFWVQRDESFLNKVSQLKGGFVFHHPENAIPFSFRDQFGVSGQDHPFSLTGQMNHLVSIFPPVIDCVITQHSQFFGQLSQHSIDKEFH